MLTKTFNDHLKLKQCFEEFLYNKFKKDVSLVTKEDLLSLTTMDFSNQSINKTTVGSAYGLIVYFTGKGQNLIFSILNAAGYAEKFGIKDFVKERHIACFNEFLENRFGKKASEVTKEELLSLGLKDFTNNSINKTKFGSVESLLHYFTGNGKNLIFSLLHYTGYVKKFGITEQEAIDAANQKKRKSRNTRNPYDPISNPANRLARFEEFLQNRFKKDLSLITREDLLSLTTLDFMDLSINQTKVGNASSLIRHFACEGQNLVFAILKDTGYAKKFGIKDFVKDRRIACFDEFLENKFKKKASEVTKNELLSLSQKDFSDKSICQTRFGRVKSVLDLARLKNPGQNSIFSILVYVGYAKKHGITEQDVLLMSSSRRSQNQTIKHSNSGEGSISAHPKKTVNLILPNKESLSFLRNGASEVQVILPTESKELAIPRTQTSHANQKPLIYQVIDRFFGEGQAVIVENEVPVALNQPSPHSSFIIKSIYPLDYLFKAGLELSGFRLSEVNVKFKINIKEYGKHVNFFYVSQAERVSERTAVDPLYFQNRLSSVRLLRISTRFFTQMADAAPTIESFYSVQQSSLRWFDAAKNDAGFNARNCDLARNVCTSHLLSKQDKIDSLRLAHANDSIELKAKHDEFMKKIEKKEKVFIKMAEKAKSRMGLKLS